MSEKPIRETVGPRSLYPSTATRAIPMLPHSSEPEDVREWINSLCDQLGTKPTTLAKSAGMAPSTINRFLTGTGPNENLTLTTIDRLAKAAAKMQPQLRRGPVLAVTLAMKVITTSVVGHVQAGDFQEALEHPRDKQYKVQVPVQEDYSKLPVIALEVRGPSMNLDYPDGSFIICVSFYDISRDPFPGEKVVVHQRGDGGWEATVKEYVIDPNGNAWLIPKSDHPDYQKSIHLGRSDKERHDDDEIKISLLVIGSYRPEKPLTPPDTEIL